MKLSPGVSRLGPASVTTCTCTVPERWAGVVAVIWVVESTVKLAAGNPPKVTPVTSAKLMPVIVTTVPPATGPNSGTTCVTAGMFA